MKKSIFILAALFAATFANAQITLLHTFNTGVYGSPEIYIRGQVLYTQSPYLFNFEADDNGNMTINLFNTDDFSLYKTTNIHLNISMRFLLYHVSRNILTTDNKTCFIFTASYGSDKSYIYDEDGQLVETINGIDPEFYKVNDQYLLLTYLHSEEGSLTYVYSLPGNGEAQEVSTPSSPKRNARKVAREGRVLVETGNNTYTLQGQEVK